jgi:CRP-like cAMP-binding protein
VAEIAAQASVYSFTGQDVIFEEGEASRGLWVLVSGRVRVYHAMADGRRQVVGFEGPVSALELSAALDGRPHMATVVALDECVLLFLSRPRLAEITRRHPAILGHFVDELCREVRRRDITTAIAATKDARGRIGCALLQLARQYGEAGANGSTRIAYRLTRQDIADRSGVTLETAIRVLSELQRQGVVRTQSQVIEILDVRALKGPTGCGDCLFDCSVFAMAQGAAAGVNGRSVPVPMVAAMR